MGTRQVIYGKENNLSDRNGSNVMSIFCYGILPASHLYYKHVRKLSKLLPITRSFNER